MNGIWRRTMSKSKIRVGDYVDLKQKFRKERDKWEETIQGNTGRDHRLPMLVTSIQRCFTTGNPNHSYCKDCPGLINGDCYGYDGEIILTKTTGKKWDDKENV